MTEEYETGFGKPPKSSQWKKGQSGNPNGRPKSKPDYLADYARILSEPVKARQPDGRTVSLDSLEAAYVQLCKKALKGDNAALFQAIGIMLDILPEGQKAEEENASEYAGAKERLKLLAGWTEEDQPAR
jgi:Family of unknown function (DUF5681)